MRTLLALAAVSLAPLAPVAGQHATDAPATAPRTRHVILVTIDGLRWQEVFGGADPDLVNKEQGGVRDLLSFRRRFWRGTPQERRALLLPFLWGTVAREGQLFGDPSGGCIGKVENPHWFSYPGYHELLCGFADERISANAKLPNPNRTVLEWLGTKEGFAGKVAAFCTWDVFPYILAAPRSGIYLRACRDPIEHGLDDARVQAKNRVFAALPSYWDDCAFDVAACEAFAEYLPAKEPRVVYVALGETDCWAHERRYDLYLEAAQRTDLWLSETWAALQAMPTYAGSTSLVVTVDHGRGDGAKWTDHNDKTPGSDRVWFAVLGPDTPPLGVRKDVEVTQGQTAATLAHLLGLDWCAAEPRARAPLPGVR
jgi:hypothetical protein